MLHIAEPGFVNRSSRLSNEVYAQVLDSIVVCCVDCAIVNKNEIFLCKRIDRPAKGHWWVMGGRMEPGLTPSEMAKKILLREVGYAVHSESTVFDLNLTISYVWGKRHQQPEDHGCHMVGLCHAVFIGDREREALNEKDMSSNFARSNWISIDTIVRNEYFHPGIRQFAQKIGEDFKLLQ